MATHFMRILSRMMVPGPARTPSRPDVRAGGRRRRFASNSNPTRSHQSPLPTHKIAILRCRGTISASVFCP